MDNSKAYAEGYAAYSETPLVIPYDFYKHPKEFHEWCDGYDDAMVAEESSWGMMTTKKYTIVTNEDDWEGLYIDNELFCEGHSLRVCDVFAALGVSPEKIIAKDFLCEWGSLPEKLDELPSDQ